MRPARGVPVQRENALAWIWRKRQQKRLSNALRETFQGDFEPGREVFRWLVRRAGLDRVPIVPGDPIATGAVIGEQNLVRQMLTMMGMDDEAIARATQKEALTRDGEIREFQRDVSHVDED